MTRKETIRRILRETYCRLAPSRIHGVGVFAVRDIPKGVDPFRVGAGVAREWVEITESEIAAAPAGVRALLNTLFVPDTDGLFRIPSLGANLVDVGSYLNHSERPNMRTADGNRFFARRKIKAGEELTVDYRTYGAQHLLK
jgi:SET domain